MAKKQRFEQIDGLPEALENKADKALVDRIHVRNYAFISNLLERNVVVDEDEFGRYIEGSTSAFYLIRFTNHKFKENTSYRFFFRGYAGNTSQRFFIRYTDGTNDQLFFVTSLATRSLVTPAHKTVDYIDFSYGSNTTVRLYDILFVEGSHFPGWIPAPEDQISDYSQTNPLLLSYIKKKPDLSNFATANEINNIYDQLSAKANERLSNVASNLSQAEKNALLGKIGATSEDWVENQGYLTAQNSMVYKPINNTPYSSSDIINNTDFNTLPKGNYTAVLTSTGNTNIPTNIGTPRGLIKFGANHSNLSNDIVIGTSGMAFKNSSNNSWRTVWTDTNFNPAQYVMISALNSQLANYGTLAGTQTWTGQNAYTQAPIVPDGTLNGHTVNLGQLNTILGDYATEAWVDNKLETIELTPGPQGDKPAHQWSGTSVRFENPNGSWGTYVNLKGNDGSDGKTWHSGTTNPSNSLGKVGDWHLNRNTWDVREKTGTSTWTVRGNIKGTDGSTWYNGVSNPTTQGVVGDWYIKTSTWDVYRKISSNSWNHYGNIKGADGVPADISNKANTNGSNTIGGAWTIDTIGSDLIGSYLHTGYFDNDSIHIPFSDALVDWKGVELGAENVPVMIAEDKTNNYIYRTGLPSNGYPVWVRTGNYVIESKHRFRVHKHENLDALDNGIGKVILTPYNAIEHQYLDVNIFGEMEVLELDIQSPERDELTGHLIRRNDYGQRISVCVRTNAKVMFTNIQGVSFPNGGRNGIYKYVWDGVWLFDGYSPNEF